MKEGIFLKFKLFSIIVGSEACVASCPFCVSGERPNKNNMQCPSVNWRNFDIAANLANRSNIDTVMLTSRGEPTLFPVQILQYLKHLKKFKFPFIELQTNGIMLWKKREEYNKYMRDWYETGLTTINISVVSSNPEINRSVYLPTESKYIDLPHLIQMLHRIGFSIRLSCVCCSGMTDSSAKINELIEFAKENEVEQITLRPVNDEYRRESAAKWIQKNKLKDSQIQDMRQFLDTNGTELLQLDRIGSVYDIDGQNVCFSVPLNMYTRDTNPDNGRQLIFFQDGHIRYEWEMSGGILL